MYGLTVMQTISNSTLMSLINKITLKGSISEKKFLLQYRYRVHLKSCYVIFEFSDFIVMYE
jgi:predicted transcriptional regulator